MSFTGVGGDITLDENGDAIKSIAINTYVDGAVKWTETLGSDGTVVSRQSKNKSRMGDAGNKAPVPLRLGKGNGPQMTFSLFFKA